MAFRDGDRGQKGYLGALLIAEGIDTLRVWAEAWGRAHTACKR